ncbi:MAG: signal peptide peptidase SppA [archaeon]|nr:signal peptide peptidase SppA [archaeon]
MKKRDRKRDTVKIILYTLGPIIILFLLIPILFDDGPSSKGNVAIIPIEGVITTDGGASTLGQTTVSSSQITEFLADAERDSHIQAIILEINSPGGSAVASDEIASAVKKSTKPTVAVIREAGASGGYWIASSTDYIIANRMSITGSIGVISSYLEFSGMMEDYGVGYERLVSGPFKDLGTPFKSLQPTEKNILQNKIQFIHEFFVDEVSENRNIPREEIARLATGEFYLGVEALNLGLIDQLGDLSTAEQYLRTKYGLQEISYVTYQPPTGLLDLLTSVFSSFSFHIGEGFASQLKEEAGQGIMLI